MNLFHEAKKILDKDGKVNPLGPYGKMKLTGQEVANYFRKNKVSDAKVKKAVEVALDMSGADTIARQEIKKFYGDKILKSKEVQNALQYANEETIIERMKMKDIFKKHKRELTKAYKTGDLSFMSPAARKAEDDLMQWAMDNGEVKTDDPDDFFDWLSRDLEDIVKGKIKEETVSEKFKPYFDRNYPRIVDFYIQFRGGKGDRITSEENKKDYEKALKLAQDFMRKNKITSKLETGTPEQGSSAYKIGLILDKKKPEWKVDLRPLVDQIAKLKTSEDHGGGYDKPLEESINENYRTLAKHGMGTETPKSVKVGTEIDYYQKDGAKYMGKVVKMDRQTYTVRDDKTKKDHKFFYHDRVKAAKLLKQGDNLGEGAFSVKLDKPYNRGDEKMYMDIIKKYGGKNLKYSPPKGRDLELDITFDGGDVKKIKSNLPNKGKGSEWISEKVEYAEYKFKNKRDAQKALDYFKSQQLIKLDINDDGLSYGELAIDAGKKDMTKYHKEVLKKFKPIDSFGTTGNSPLKKILDMKYKKENASVMDSYRQMWEDSVMLGEAVADVTVDLRNKLSKPADQNKHALNIVKQARRFNLKASMMGKHVRLKGAKKAVNDFLRVIIGKSSYGDPTEQDTSTPQIDKMLTKGLK